MVSNEKPEDQGPKEDVLSSEAVTVIRLLQEFLGLTLGQLYEISISMSGTCTGSHGLLSLHHS